MVDDLLQELRTQARAAGNAHDVRLIETHISWVLLGSEVYKIKKPVVFPFLDFSTYEKRELACRAEVRVNRRLAPKTYLGLAPIRRGATGRATFGASGPIIDWAVRMVRLDDRQRADTLLGAGELTGELIDTLAAGIAAFHADAPTGIEISRQGSPAVIERNVSDNFDALERMANSAAAMPARVVEEARRWQIAFLRGHQDLFERRVATGAIRDGHGDLRLEHVFFTGDGDFDIIDAIEFDDRFRHGDVCADVAFLAMDLARLGRVDLAERFLASYARAANDFELYRLVDFYESYRACVRAKISAAVADDPDASDDLRRRALAEARRYLLLAATAGRRSVLQPVLVAIAGGIASGKSTLADELRQRLGAPVIDADSTRKHMLGLAPTVHADTPAWTGPYNPRFSERVYAEVLHRADAVLASGRPVIVDASFRTAAARAAARALANAHNVPFRLLECDAPADVCRARLALRDRATSVSDGRAEVFDAFRASFEPITELPPTEHVRIDTGGALADAIDQVTKVIPTWPLGLVG